MDSFIQWVMDGNEHVLMEHFVRGRYTMRGSFRLGHWDFKKKKMIRGVIIHWYYKKNDPEWTYRELKLRAYWPIVDPWIRKRLMADTNSFDEAAAPQRHERPRA